MTDDSWTVDDDAAVAAAGQQYPEHPMFTAYAFLSGLSEGYSHQLHVVVTPESLEAWGDFSEARAALDAIPNWGVGSYPMPSGVADVVYAKVLADVEDSYQVDATRAVNLPAVVTLVWRPEAGPSGLWLVHGFGQPIDPERVPRSSPGTAPTY